MLFCVSRTTRIRLLRLFTLWFERKQRICAMRLTQNSVRRVYSPKWQDETNCWIKSLFLFSLRTKLFLSLHKVQIEPLMADGLFWRCLSHFSGHWQCNLLGSQWDSHKPPGFHTKYIKLCSEDEQTFTGLDRHGGKWLMTKFSFWCGVTL